ncbi:MAG: carbohydrate binding family 9 domain-containing protein, partial [Saprospiraceae bacterium]|nr:carbohydrate binding family 9 domain-containing protein [Saprospiraceae bacterium]
MKKLLTSVCCLLCSTLLLASNQDKRVLTAGRTEQPIKIDGVLDEMAWRNAQVATDFTQLEPNPGAPPTHPTEVRIVYNDQAIYIGAKLYDNPDEIARQLFERDDISDDHESDWFGVAFDTYRDGINGNAFLVTPAGVQIDLKFTSDGDDDAWDAVWDSEVTIVSDGWIVEMEIPYSALRFPDKDIQEWHLQLARKRFASQEESFWNPMDPEQNGFFTQAGILQGIENIKSP